MAPRQWRNRIIGHGEEDAEQLLANPKNWRIHPREQQEALEAVLANVGWVQNVIVNKRTGFVVDGHARVAMAISKQEPVPVVYVDLSEQEESLILATLDPLSAMAGKDDELFAELIAGMDDAYKALVAMTTDISVDSEGLTDPDATPELDEHPVSETGDIWIMGRHLVRCGDSTNAADVEALLAGVSPHLMVTDPPYGVEYDPKWRLRAGVNKVHQKRAEGVVANDDRADWSDAWHLFPGDVAYVWHGALHSGVVEESLRACGFEMRAQIIWAKTSLVMGRGHYHWQHEPCWYAVRSTGHWVGDRRQSTLWQIANMHATQGNVDDGKTNHSTQKPVECMKRPIENNSSIGQAVYDPFLGSGTTIIAAEMTGRACYGMELDRRYVDMIVKRWQEFTGKEAILDGDGRTFRDVANARGAASGTGVRVDQSQPECVVVAE